MVATAVVALVEAATEEAKTGVEDTVAVIMEVVGMGEVAKEATLEVEVMAEVEMAVVSMAGVGMAGVSMAGVEMEVVMSVEVDMAVVVMG